MKTKAAALNFSIFVLGMSSILTQIILLREFLTIFKGNELITGLIISLWMLLSGAGAYIGKFLATTSEKLTGAYILHILLGIIPVATIFLVVQIITGIYAYGEMLGLFDIFIISALLLAPYCIISGMLFTYYSEKISDGANEIPKVYFLDSFGSIAGGLAFNFFLISFFTNYQSLAFIMAINIAAAIFISFRMNAIFPKIIAFGLIALFILIFRADFEKFSAEKIYPGQEILFLDDTPYGKIAVTESHQLNFYENGILLFSGEQVKQNEEAVHLPLMQRDDHENILLIGGGASGKAGQILKYNPRGLDYVEINPALVNAAVKFTDNLETERINVITTDARIYVRNTKKKYDAVIIDAPDPGNARLNRYYTDSFFESLKRLLKRNGIISLSLNSSANYLSDEELRLHSVIFKTLEKNFRNVIIVPQSKTYFIASDGTLTMDYGRLLRKYDLDNKHINAYYLDEFSMQMRSDQIRESLLENVSINRDFNPAAYREQLQYWMELTGVNEMIIPLVLFLLLTVGIIFLRPVDKALFAGGFTGALSQIIIIIAFQVFFGYIYWMIGLLVTAFMGGITFGAYYLHKTGKLSSKRSFAQLLGYIMISALILPVLLNLMNKSDLNEKFLIFSLFIIIFGFGFLTGSLFINAARLKFSSGKKVKSIAADTFGADMAGSAIGALGAAVVLIPNFGILNTCYFAAGINAVAMIFLIFGLKKNRI